MIVNDAQELSVIVVFQSHRGIEIHIGPDQVTLDIIPLCVSAKVCHDKRSAPHRIDYVRETHRRALIRFLETGIETSVVDQDQPLAECIVIDPKHPRIIDDEVLILGMELETRQTQLDRMIDIILIV